MKRLLGRGQEGALTSGSLVSSGSITILLWQAQSSALGRPPLPCVEFAILLLGPRSPASGEGSLWDGLGQQWSWGPPRCIPAPCLLPSHIFSGNTEGPAMGWDLLGEGNTNCQGSPTDLRPVH